MNATVNAETFSSGNSYIVDGFNDNIVFIENGANVTGTGGGNIAILHPVTLYNYGSINGQIDARYNLSVYNSGTIHDGITTVNGGNVTQIINSPEQITNISVVGGNYTVRIEGCENLDFNSIKDMNVGTFVITDSSVVINDFSQWQNWGKDVVLEGRTILIINDVDTDISGNVINNISSGQNYLTVQIRNGDDLYSAQLEQSGSGLVLNVARTTDYNLVFNNGNPSYSVLEKIRNKHPNDKLIKALDAAENIEQIYNIKNNSYRFNHGILLRPVKLINSFALFDGIEEHKDVVLGITPFYIGSDSVNNFGGRVYIGDNYDNLYLNLGFSFNSFSYEDNLNDFSGLSYGLDIRAKQKINNFWLFETAGFTIANFNADYVSDDNELKDNPSSFSGYGKFDAGYDFELDSDLTLSPFIGVSYTQDKVISVSEKDLNLHGGTDIKYNFITDGIKYEYSLSGALMTGGDFYSEIKIGFWSVVDKVGVSFDAAVFKDNFDYNYKLSVNAKMEF